MRVGNTPGAVKHREERPDRRITVYNAFAGRADPRSSRADTGSIALSHGLGSRVQTLETDLVAGGVVTKKPMTSEDTRNTRKGTPTHNTTNKPLHSTLPRFGARIRMFQCSLVWGCSSLLLALPRTVKVTLAFPVDHRDGGTMDNSTDSTTQWTWGSLCRPPVMATTYSPPHANTEGSAAARREYGATRRVGVVSNRAS